MTQVKKLLHTFGKILGIVGFLYLFYTLSQEFTLETFILKFSSVIAILPLLLFLNFISVLLGIYTWHSILLNYTSRQFPFIASYYYFAKTEIAKYLPGNVFHIIGRQALASNIGISQLQMGKTSLLFSLLLLAGTVFSSTLFTLFSKSVPQYILTLMILGCILTMIVIIVMYKSFHLTKKVKLNIIATIGVTLQGIMLASIILYQEQNFTIYDFFLYTSTYIISWLIGFITPGASGGLGVREGAFITIVHFLHLSISSEIILFSVLLVRVINIGIDIILYLSTFILKSKLKVYNFEI